MISSSDKNITQEGCNLKSLNKEGVNQLGVVSPEYREEEQQLLVFNFMQVREREKRERGVMASSLEYVTLQEAHSEKR